MKNEFSNCTGLVGLQKLIINFYKFNKMNLTNQNLIVTKSFALFIVLFLSASLAHAQNPTRYSDLNTAGTGGDRDCTYIGDYAGANNTGDNNTFIGAQAGRSNVNGIYNAYLGMQAGLNVDGGQNVFVGMGAGRASYDVTGPYNTSRNTYVGYYAAFQNDIGTGNAFLGYQAGYESNGGENVFVGDQVGYKADGTENVFLGRGTGSSATGTENIFLGRGTGSSVVGDENIFLGQQAGTNTVGDENVFLGSLSGLKSQGNGNVFLGREAGFNVVGFNNASGDGDGNVILGRKAGYRSRGSGNVFLGDHVGIEVEGDNKLYIDNTDTDLPLIYGDFLKDELTVNGSLDIDALDNDPAILSLTATDNDGWDSAIQFKVGNTVRHLIIDNTDENRLVIAPGFDQKQEEGTQQVHVSGELLVGAANNWITPQGYRLFVKEGILTEKVQVAPYGSINWADFVFEEDYDLNSTEEVEQFIKENKHLPNVPSVQEVNENGVDMVEMDATLLRQIEELWLHVIELKKENEALKEEVKVLKK